MSQAREIHLGDRAIPVNPLPLGQLRRLLPVFTRVGRQFALGQVEEEALAGLTEIIALATGKPVDELDALPCTYVQLLQALDTISDVCGLKPVEGGAPGEGRPGPAASLPSPGSTPGTASTVG